MPSLWAFPSGSVIKNPLAMPETQETRFDPWIRKISWGRKWQPTPVFLLGKSQGQRDLVGYNPWGDKESDMSEHEHAHTSKFKCNYFVNYVLQQISKVKFIK